MLEKEAAVFVGKESDEHRLVGGVGQAQGLGDITVLLEHLPESEHRRVIVT